MGPEVGLNVEPNRKAHTPVDNRTPVIQRVATVPARSFVRYRSILCSRLTSTHRSSCEPEPGWLLRGTKDATSYISEVTMIYARQRCRQKRGFLHCRVSFSCPMRTTRHYGGCEQMIDGSTGNMCNSDISVAELRTSLK
jgi:hypothetical protein